MSQDNFTGQRKREANQLIGRANNKLSRIAPEDAMGENNTSADVDMSEGILVLDTPVKSESDKKSYR